MNMAKKKKKKPDVKLAYYHADVNILLKAPLCLLYVQLHSVPDIIVDITVLLIDYTAHY